MENWRWLDGVIVVLYFVLVAWIGFQFIGVLLLVGTIIIPFFRRAVGMGATPVRPVTGMLEGKR